jgi:hypothetical protein
MPSRQVRPEDGELQPTTAHLGGNDRQPARTEIMLDHEKGDEEVRGTLRPLPSRQIKAASAVEADTRAVAISTSKRHQKLSRDQKARRSRLLSMSARK